MIEDIVVKDAGMKGKGVFALRGFRRVGKPRRRDRATGARHKP